MKRSHLAVAHPILYEINTRCWLRQLSDARTAGTTLSEVPNSEFERWRSLGFTHIWLMGVWTVGPLARAQALSDPGLRESYGRALPGWREDDVGGSPYAIADYRVSEALGGEEGLTIFRRRLHEYGMKLVLDFVPNHLGLDHQWVREQPELFVQSSGEAPGVFVAETVQGKRWMAHGKDPYFPGWTDTVQLDYRRGETRNAMEELLVSVSQRCDGVRCDMAMLVLSEVFAKTWESFPRKDAEQPSEFWPAAISRVKRQNPEFVFVAEAYWGLESALRSQGFDCTYDKGLYDHLVARNGPETQQHLLCQSTEQIAGGAHFLENHDEPRIASILSSAEQRAAAVLTLGLPGMRFVYHGQLVGAQIRTPVQLLKEAAEPADMQTSQMYEEIFAALGSSAVGQGKPELLKTSAAWDGNWSWQAIVAIQWQKYDEGGFDLAIVNYAPHRSQCYVRPSLAGLAENNWLLKDRLGAEVYERSGHDLAAQGLYLDVPEWSAQIFHFLPLRKPN